MTLSDIINTTITAGFLRGFLPGGNIINTQITVAGRLDQITIHGNFDGDSSITTHGLNGSIDSLTVTGNFFGTIDASGRVGAITIGTPGDPNTGDVEVGSSIIIRGTNPQHLALGSLRVYGDLFGSLQILGDVGSIIVGGSMGVLGDDLSVAGDLTTLRVGTSPSNPGTLNMGLLINGNVKTIEIIGYDKGDITIRGDLGSFKLTAPLAALNPNNDPIFTASLEATGNINTASVTGGDVSKSIIAGLNLGTLSITGGSLLSGAEIGSVLGNIGTVTIKGGDLLGSVLADTGNIGNISVTGGGNLGTNARISSRTAGIFSFDGSILSGGVIAIAQALLTLNIGQDIQPGSNVAINVITNLNIVGAMLGTLSLGAVAAGTKIKIGTDLAGNLTSAGNTSLTVGGNILQGAIVSIGKNLDQLSVKGSVSGDIFVDGKGGSWTVGNLTGAVLTTSFGLDSLTVTNGFATSLLQVGISRGVDGVFSSSQAGKDLGETSRMANLGKVTAGSISDSLIASGGDIGSLNTPSMTNSNAIAGWSLGSVAIASILADSSILASPAGQALTGDDRQLFRGNINSASVNFFSDSNIVAGVDSGDGIFGDGDESVLIPGSRLPQGGGSSSIGSVSITNASGNSNIIASNGVKVSGPQGGLNVIPNVTYDVESLLTNHSLEPSVGTASAGQDLSYTLRGGVSVTIRLTGPGTLDAYDAITSPDDNTLDTLILRGTTSATTVTITSSAASNIGRIISTAGSTLGTFTYDGTLVGDGTQDPDLWIDGKVNTFSLGGLGDNVEGRINGDLGTLNIGTQGAGLLQINGTLGTLNVIKGNGGNGLVVGIGATPSNNITSIATDSSGKTWVYDASSNTISQVNADTGVITVPPISVTDIVSGNAISLTTLGFDNFGTLFGTSVFYNVNPAKRVGSLDPANTARQLVGLAVSPTGQIVAIDTSTGTDRLVSLDANSGRLSVLGTVRDLFNNTFSGQISQLAFGADGTLYALLSDRDGNGFASDSSNGAAIAKIQSSDVNNDGFVDLTSPTSSFLPAKFLTNGGPVIADGALAAQFTSMTISSNGTVYAVLRDLQANVDQLVSIVLGTGTMTNLGQIKVNGLSTSLVGIGFDETGKLIGESNDGASAQLVQIDPANPATNSFNITTAALLNPNLTAFAFGRSGSHYATYAYDTNDPANGNSLYTNSGTAATLGTIGTSGANLGKFTQALPLLMADSTPIAGNVTGIAVDSLNTGNIFVGTDAGHLAQYDSNGNLILDYGTLTDPQTGAALKLGGLEFDPNTGLLIALDLGQRRILALDVTSDPNAVKVLVQTEAGVLPFTVSTISYDTVNARFIGITNDQTAHTSQFVQIIGTNQDSIGGLTAKSVSNVNITGGQGYSSRVATTGNSFGNISVKGDFGGVMFTNGNIGGYKQTAGNYTGALYAGGDMGAVSISGNVDAGAVITTRGKLTSFSNGGNFNGTLTAASSGGVTVGKNFGTTGSIAVAGDTGAVKFTGSVAGTASFGKTASLSVGGLLTSSGLLTINGNTANINLASTATGSKLHVLGSASSLTVSGTHSGQIAVDGGINSTNFNIVTNGLLVAGRNSGTLTVKGDVTGSVFDFGVTIGADNIFNTNDDSITGGSLNSATFMKNVFDSVIAAGVLPRVTLGQFTAGSSNNLLFSGNANAANLVDKDSAEAGGILQSNLGKITVKGRMRNITNTNVVVAAGKIAGITSGPDKATVTSRTYDPTTLGAPQNVTFRVVSNNEIRATFSNPLNTASLTVAKDNNGNSSIYDAIDTLGSVAVYGGTVTYDPITGLPVGNVLNDVTVDYADTIVNGDGSIEHNVLRIFRNAGFTQGVFTVTLEDKLINVSQIGQVPSVYGRSGLRSTLTLLNYNHRNELGTILDGNLDGIEGSTPPTQLPAIISTLAGDAPDTFALAQQNQYALPVDAGVTRITNTIATSSDIDIYSFTATAWQFFEAKFANLASGVVGLFHLDTQGTADPSDDSWELVTRWLDDSDRSANGTITLASELSDGGQYALVVGANPLAFFKPDPAQKYTVTMKLASSDEMLDGIANNKSAGLAPDVKIAYVSHALNAHNNTLGFNSAKTLVYLNFRGGTTTQFGTFADSTFTTFNATTLDTLLASQEATLINGGLASDSVTGTSGVITGIVDNIMSIFSNTPSSEPLGKITVKRINGAADWAAFNAASDGLYFTTLDPATAMATGLLAPGTVYKTAFIGETTGSLEFTSDLLGLTSSIPVANAQTNNEVVVITQNFQHLTDFTLNPPVGLIAKLQAYSNAIANVTAHEIGHALGLNHQPTDYSNFMLTSDDPDNNPLTPNDSNTGVALMAYSFNDQLISGLYQLGTTTLTTSEFPIGNIDTADLLSKWLIHDPSNPISG